MLDTWNNSDGDYFGSPVPPPVDSEELKELEEKIKDKVLDKDNK
jgi:hypothetical protein